jgi:hypothetical protein
MLKEGCKKLLFQSLGLSRRMRLACALLWNVVRTASKQDISLLEKLFALLDLIQTSLEDRIRQLKLTGRTVPDPPTKGCRSPCVTWVLEDRAP